MADVTQLRPQKRNANKHTQRGMSALEQSVQADGWIGAITVAADDETFDGSARIETAATTGFEDAIVVESDGTRPVVVRRIDIPTADDPRAVRLGLAANRVAELNLDWDTTVLADLGASIDLSQFWTREELAGLLEQEIVAGGGGEEAPAVEEGPTRVQLGEIWACGEHRVACIDCTDTESVQRLLGDDHVDMVITDPPYGMNLDTDYSPISRNWKGQVPFAQSKQYAPVIGDDREFDPAFLLDLFSGCQEVFLWGGDYFADKLPKGGGWFVWDKTGYHTQQVVGSEFELCWSKQAHKRQIVSVKWSGVMGLQSQDVKHRVHPTQKPLEVYSFFVEHYSKEGDIVADLYAGAGTSIVVAERLRRKARLAEIDPRFCDVILKRFEAETGLSAVRVDA